MVYIIFVESICKFAQVYEVLFIVNSKQRRFGFLTLNFDSCQIWNVKRHNSYVSLPISIILRWVPQAIFGEKLWYV